MNAQQKEAERVAVASVRRKTEEYLDRAEQAIEVRQDGMIAVTGVPNVPLATIVVAGPGAAEIVHTARKLIMTMVASATGEPVSTHQEDIHLAEPAPKGPSLN